jgi:hypothetical protein
VSELSHDPVDDATWGLVYPFIVCRSQGGPYDDQAFAAGWQCGRIDSALAAAAALGLDRARFTVRTATVEQLKLVGAHHGYSNVAAVESDGIPEWTEIVFRRSEHGL